MAITRAELSRDFTPDYEVPITSGYAPYRFHINPNRPIFYNWFIPLMMKDPRLKFGIEIIKGPILQSVDFGVNCYDSVAGDTIYNTLQRFWENSANSALHCMLVYGYTGQEIMYQVSEEDGELEFDHLKYISPYDCKPVSKDGHIIGMNVYRTKYANKQGPQYVPCPKTFWAVHEPETNYWFGRTRLFGAFEPWWEKWSYRGFRDLRANWFYRNSFNGPIVRYPPGATPLSVDDTGNVVNKIANQDLAAKIIDDYQAGSGVAVPNNPQQSGQLWEIEASDARPVPTGLDVYGRNLDDELLEGIGVPPEVIISDGTGAYAGRQVPLQAFYSALQEPAKMVKNAVCNSIVNPILYLRFGRRIGYDVKITGLVESLPTASDGMYPSDVTAHNEVVAGRTGEKNQEDIAA